MSHRTVEVSLLAGVLALVLEASLVKEKVSLLAGLELSKLWALRCSTNRRRRLPSRALHLGDGAGELARKGALGFDAAFLCTTMVPTTEGTSLVGLLLADRAPASSQGLSSSDTSPLSPLFENQSCV